jgi:quinolinate synthase
VVAGNAATKIKMTSEILELKKRKDVSSEQAQVNCASLRSSFFVLAHYYQPMEIQRAADAVGDSFELAKRAAEAKQDTLIFCGVRFMAESAKILSPEKTVILPVESAGCPMADMVTPEDVLRLRKEHPKAAVMAYVNTSAEVKAVCDVCCTSSSAERVARSIAEDEIIFLPDKNLGAYISALVPEKRFILFDGNCPVHNGVTADHVRAARQADPDARILLHPECPAEAVKLADGAGSTSWILEQVEKSPHGSRFVIGTEEGVVERLKETAPGRECRILMPDFICRDMKKTTLSDLYGALNGEGAVIELDKAVMDAARNSLVRMMNV